VRLFAVWPRFVTEWVDEDSDGDDDDLLNMTLQLSKQVALRKHAGSNAGGRLLRKEMTFLVPDDIAS